VNRSTTDNPAHGWITRQPVGIVHVVIASEPPKYGLTQQAGQDVPRVLAATAVWQCRTVEVGAMPSQDGLRLRHLGCIEQIGGQIRVIHTNNARSLLRSRRPGGTRLNAMLS
jgi:hypothetical protein